MIACCGLIILSLQTIFGADTNWGSMRTQVEQMVQIVCALESALFLGQKIGIASLQSFGLYGSFDNPAGLASCLCIGFPCGFISLSGEKSRYRRYFWIGKSLCVFALLASGSRSGLICIMLIIMMKLCRGQGKARFLAVSTFLLFFVFLVFYIKQDSTNGRFFIYQRSIELMRQKLIWGWGLGGFDKFYMNCQADFFMAHPDSPYALLADNIRHPLCEWLLCGINFGLTGVVSILLLLTYTVKVALRKCNNDRTGLEILMVVFTMSLFSYPMSYPFTWLMLMFAIDRIYGISWKKEMSCFLLPISAWSLLACLNNSKLDMEMLKLQKINSHGIYETTLPEYMRLYNSMGDNFYFLYSYAVALCESGRPSEAFRVIRECQAKVADYDVCLLAGDICCSIGKYDEAIGEYQRAHYMCPSRFIPLYELLGALRKQGKTNDALTIAREIVDKPIKVESVEIDRIVDEAKRFVASNGG